MKGIEWERFLKSKKMGSNKPLFVLLSRPKGLFFCREKPKNEGRFQNDVARFEKNGNKNWNNGT